MMQVRNISLAEFRAATERVSADRYSGNVKVHADAASDGAKGQSCHGRIDVADSYGPGSRTSSSGRHGPYACWHAYRDVMRELFRVNPDAVIITALARYDGSDGFESTYPGTADRNVGSMMYPAYMPELCVC